MQIVSAQLSPEQRALNPLFNYYVLHTYGDVEPHLYGPYLSEERRNAKARELRKLHPDDGVYPLEIDGLDGTLEAGSFSGALFDEEE